MGYGVLMIQLLAALPPAGDTLGRGDGLIYHVPTDFKAVQIIPLPNSPVGAMKVIRTLHRHKIIGTGFNTSILPSFVKRIGIIKGRRAFTYPGHLEKVFNILVQPTLVRGARGRRSFPTDSRHCRTPTNLRLGLRSFHFRGIHLRGAGILRLRTPLRDIRIHDVHRRRTAEGNLRRRWRVGRACRPLWRCNHRRARGG